MKGTTYNGIFFTENSILDTRILQHLKIEISRQNSDLSKVKEQLSLQAKSLGANAIMNFRYGQRAHSIPELFKFKWDTESWYGEGDAVKIAMEE